jgi:hypothetical protein|tara:strand:- start:792 stop:3527 length:2736 start_codon:yes stop_codon:yes gene_type:complete
MSVQLILYPQNHDGQFNVISFTPNEYVVNGIDFTGFNSTSSYDSPTFDVFLDSFSNQPPNILSTWFRFRSTALGTPALPVESSGNITFNSGAFLSFSGIYQRLSNLVVGQQYTITVNVSTTGTGLIFIGAFNNATVIVNQGFNATSSVITHNFTANSTTNTLSISYFNSAADDVTISNISVQQTEVSPSGGITELADGQVICDLYEDEDLPLSLSVDDFKNVAEKVQSYSKAFNLPATKRNNQIFDNIFEVTRTSDSVAFNPYAKTQCQLKQDGFILFEGYLRLLDVNDKDGEISYDVNLYSEVIALADVLEDKTFSDLDFSELDHDYNYTQIRNSWQGILGLQSALEAGTFAGTVGATTTNVLRYPFVDWNHSYGIGTNEGPSLPNLESSFRPFISIKYLIDMIFNQPDFPFTYESVFFDSNADFQNLFMDFNWGSDNTPVENAATTYESYYLLGVNAAANYATTSYSTLILSHDVPLLGGDTPPNYNDSTDIITSTVANEFYNVTYSYIIKNFDTVSREVECQWLYNNEIIDYSGVQTIPAGGQYLYTGTFNQVMTVIGDTLKAQFRTNAGTANKVGQGQANLVNGGGAIVQFGVGTEAITTNAILQTLRGELGQWEFLKGIFTMFNLVSIPDNNNPNHILIEPYKNIFLENADSSELDWTDKVDVSEIKLTPLTDLNKTTMFKFVEDDEDYAFNVYKHSVKGHLYGSLTFDASTTTNNLQSVLSGEKEVIAEPFAATLSKALMTQFTDFIVPRIYSYNEDNATSEGFDNSPRIMYNNGVKTLTSCTYDVPAQNGVAGDATEDEFLQFSHLSSIPALSTSSDFHFGICQLPFSSFTTPNNLFGVYWQPYFNELYNPDTRTMTIKVNLTAGDINTFKFYDIVFIKNREYRVNKIDYKPNDLSTVEFILIP